MKRFSVGLAGSIAIVVVASSLSLQCATRGGSGSDAGVTADAGPGADAGPAADAGPGADAGPNPTATTITQVQNDTVSPGTCVQVSAVVMSLPFDDTDDTFFADGGSVPRKAFYISEKGITTTAPRTGIEVVVNTGLPDPSVSPGDDVTIVAEYNEHFDNSTLRITASCGTITRNGTAATPAPATLTITQLGQTGGSSGCPPTGNPWLDASNAEDYEGVLVTITAGLVSQPFNSNFGLFEVTDDGTTKLQVHNVFGTTAMPELNGTVQSITGFSHFSFCRRKLRPRNDGELMIQAPTINCGAGPKADHVLLTEVKLSPTAGEFVEIHNPTANPIDLSNYYMWSATFAGSSSDGGPLVGECRYYNIGNPGDCSVFDPTAQQFGDFVVRFPAGATISAGEYQVFAITGSLNYCSAYFSGQTCPKPNYEIPPPAADDGDVPNMRSGHPDGTTTTWDTSVFSSFGFLTRSTEDMVLFKWDGPGDGGTSLVQDVDYFVWGTSDRIRTDKTGVAGYQADTPVGSQEPQVELDSSAAFANSYQRVCLNEGTETTSSGNGITGHNETSENLATTWVVRTQTPKAATVGAQP